MGLIFLFFTAILDSQMEQLKGALDKILSNEITAFLFVFACSVGATAGVVGGYWLLYKTFVYLGT